MPEITTSWPTGSGELLLGVMGDPIAQSKSPIMHTAALRSMGISGAYVPLHITPDQLGDAVGAIRTLGFRGVNVTIPHKVAVMAYLDTLDDSAREIGAVNTIVNSNGHLTGYNTDGIGYVRSLKAEVISDLSGTHILVIGAGGAARGIIAALLREAPASIVVANRTSDKALELAAEWSKKGDIRGVGLDQLSGMLKGFDVIINTTSVGMYPHMDQTPLEPSQFREGTVVSDLIYNPLRTLLLQESLKRGCRIHGGLGMFVYQGAYALEYWTGQPAPVEIMRQTILNCLGGTE